MFRIIILNHCCFTTKILIKRTNKIIKMWYYSYGWKANPFLIKPNPNVINYELEKEKLKDYIYSGDICFLVGEPGTGKTSLLKWLELNLDNHFIVYINVETVDQNFSIKNFLKEHTRFSRKLFGLPYPKNTVFLLDESKEIKEDFRNALKSHFDENHIKSIVFSQPGTEPEIPVGFRHRTGNRLIKISRLSEEKSFELVKNRCGKICPFTEGAITLIIDRANNLPRKILEICEKVAIELKGKKEITINDVQNILKIRQAEKPKLTLSPMEESIINILKETHKTAQELAELLSTTEGSVGKQLSKLMQKNQVNVISHKRPKVYGVIQI